MHEVHGAAAGGPDDEQIGVAVKAQKIPIDADEGSSSCGVGSDCKQINYVSSRFAV